MNNILIGLIKRNAGQSTIENKSGNLHILVSNSDGEEIYKGDNPTSGKFSFEIPKTDTYKFSVTGINAKGSVSFKVTD